MRVVVTRPQASGMKTAQLLRQRGHEVILLPLVRPLHLAQACVDAFASRPAAFAVTSAEAIRALEEHLPRHPAIPDVPLYAVGAASAKAAQEAGFKTVSAGQSDGSALAELIANDCTAGRISGGITYLAGTLREDGFERRLSSLDIPFETVEVYGMSAVDWSRHELEHLLGSEAVDGVLLYSADAARRFFALCDQLQLSTWLARAHFVCISEKVRSQVPEPFRHVAWASTDPVEDQMFDLLEQKAGT
ncbi:hypothetical protein ASF69_08445 [Rhizobium sp. Leaf311]|uniref:uroporphyrinogen-III synthase n=1 Tax=Rhizobium sp. Leaf311 TaxID=1736332 RepID=UPI0007148150|nr:uroporphyrinogen-III synthase [Rhizobium sp. Leaf311]KQQ45424.1 hypothetical protein ASF69_08445 [Rhizobium sp. Leaf311]